MEVRALLLVNRTADTLADPIPLSPLPPPLLEVAGKTPLQRTVERLRRFGVQTVTVVTESDLLPPASSGNGHGETYLSSLRERYWRTAESAFNDVAQEGGELVLLMSLGPYAEIDFEKLVQFHLDKHARVTQAYKQSQPLQIFCISASRRNDAASLLRSQLSRCRVDCAQFEHTGYVNPLQDARDLRQFAIDILTLKTETTPCGTEVRPGIWIGKGALIEKGARLVAPAFVGAMAKIRSHAVITRCSSVEHHGQVDCGTVTENSTVLPYCRVGAGLDVAHSVVGAGVIANLRRDATVEVPDPKLIGYVAAAAGQRFFNAAIEFAAYLPRQAWQGLFGKQKEPEPDLQTALGQTSPSLGNAAGYQAPACDANAAEEFPSSLAVMRRYGHQ